MGHRFAKGEPPAKHSGSIHAGRNLFQPIDLAMFFVVAAPKLMSHNAPVVALPSESLFPSNTALGTPRLRDRAEADVLSACDEGGASDASLVSRAIAGDRWAEEMIFRRHVRCVAGTVIRLLRSADDAEDIVQDTFATALSALDQIREPRALRSWLIQIAIRKVHRRLRREKVLRSLGLRASDSDDDDADGLAAIAGPGCRADVRVELIELDAVLRKLPVAERLAWILRRVEGHTVADIARLCRCSVATAKRRIGAAELRIRERVVLAGADS